MLFFALKKIYLCYLAKKEKKITQKKHFFGKNNIQFLISPSKHIFLLDTDFLADDKRKLNSKGK